MRDERYQVSGTGGINANGSFSGNAHGTRYPIPDTRYPTPHSFAARFAARYIESFVTLSVLVT